MRHFILILLLLVIQQVQAQTLEEKIKQRVELGETPGIAVAIYENGKLKYYTYGVSNLTTKELVTPKTLFEIGSITKTFTCNLTALLSENKQLSFSDYAQKYLPSKIILPERNGKVITIEHLATAHSGLPRMPLNFQPKDPLNPYIDYREDELAFFLSRYELTRDPGAEYEYSNLGMGLLGYILTQVTKKTYSQLVEELITKPLAMNNTFISGMRNEKLLATGYTDKLAMKAWTWDDESVITGAGGIVSNAEDMMKYLVAQLGTSGISKSFSLTHQPRTDAGKMKIGYGWHIRDENIVWHNGGTGGFRSFAGFDKTKNKAVVILTNSTSGADDLGFHLLDEKYELKKIKQATTIDATVLKNYVGTYEVNPAFKITVTLEGNDLFIQATGQPKINIYAESETIFFLKAVNAQIEFEKNDSDKVERLKLNQNGITLTGNKID